MIFRSSDSVILTYRTPAGERQVYFSNVPIVDGAWHTILLHFHTTRTSSEVVLYIDCSWFGQITLEDRLGRVFTRQLIESAELRLGMAGIDKDGTPTNALKVRA